VDGSFSCVPTEIWVWVSQVFQEGGELLDDDEGCKYIF
jgi:hypothetical protein